MHFFFKTIFVASFVASSAIAQGNTPTKDQKNEASTTDSSNESAPAAEKRVSNEDNGGGILLPFGKIGPTVGITVPRVYDIGLEARLMNAFGVGFSYTPSSSISSGTLKISTTQWNIRGTFIPWQGSFFVGAQYGSQEVSAEIKQDIKATVNGSDVWTPATVSAKVTSNYMTPMLGWQWVTGIGLMFGTELGAQIPIGASSSFDAAIHGNAAADAAVKETNDYKDVKKKAEDGGKLAGNTILPYWNVFKIGWLL